MRKWNKKEVCYAWSSNDKKCLHKDKCSFLCSDYHKFIGGITNPNDYLNITHNRHNRKLATLSLIFSFLALVITLTTSTITIVTKSNDKVQIVSNSLFEAIKTSIKDSSK
jgi:hypothetical protein